MPDSRIARFCCRQLVIALLPVVALRVAGDIALASGAPVASPAVVLAGVRKSAEGPLVVAPAPSVAVGAVPTADVASTADAPHSADEPRRVNTPSRADAPPRGAAPPKADPPPRADVPPSLDPPPSVFGVDAPELARMGPFSVGVKTLSFVDRDQPDLLAIQPGSATIPRHDRKLTVDIWYPATAAPNASRATYHGSLPSEPPAPPAPFSVPGIAVRNAPPAGTAYPLVVVSHGYSNSTAAMTWLTENLASKGYVVAAIEHDDPPITDRSKYPQLLLRRPLDIAFITGALQQTLGAQHLVDPAKTALVGYSMGGYGVLTAAGAALDPTGPPAKLVPGGLLMPYVRSAPESTALNVKSLRAVVAISPAGGGTLAAWGTEGLKGVHAPLLLIAGNKDRTVDYTTGARAIFDSAIHSRRYLLTFQEAGHALGLNATPVSMRGRLWDKDWFEDPVWRKERISAINVHFITAFLDRYVKADASRDAYLDVRTPDSDDGVWPAQPSLPYDAYSPSDGVITVWKGFQRNHAAGLQLLRAAPSEGAPVESAPAEASPAP
jgi:predicted dienelactone hydrolase